MSDIPAARELVAAARRHIEAKDREAADLLARAEEMMWREKPGKPGAPTEAKKVTPSLKRATLAYHRRHPRASVFTMATKFGSGVGRISEVINGKR